MANGDNMTLGQDNHETLRTRVVLDNTPDGNPQDCIYAENQGAGTAIGARTRSLFAPAVAAAGRALGVESEATEGPAIHAYAELHGAVAGNPAYPVILAHSLSDASRGGVLDAFTDGDFAIHGHSTAFGYFPGAYPSSFPAGVWGTSIENPGVAGQSDQAQGVLGSSVENSGVAGQSLQAQGVLGSSSTVGVQGTSDGGDPNSATGVMGDSAQGQGVRGHSHVNIGVLGQSDESAGVVGWTTGNGNAVVGVPTGSGYAIVGESPSRNGNAGYFRGNVVVDGPLTVFGPKSAAVQHPDGSRRRLYSLEAPESWLEDFGEVTLTRSAKVRLDPAFRALIDTRHYHVFLSPYDDVQVHVANRAPDAFEIRVSEHASKSKGRGHGKFTCSYRVVAKRADIPGPRLEKVKLPQPQSHGLETERPTQVRPPAPRSPELPDVRKLPSGTPSAVAQ
jgi:hypothetical protein